MPSELLRQHSYSLLSEQRVLRRDRFQISIKTAFVTSLVINAYFCRPHLARSMPYRSRAASCRSLVSICPSWISSAPTPVSRDRHLNRLSLVGTADRPLDREISKGCCARLTSMPRQPHRPAKYRS